MKNLLRKIFFWDEPAKGAFFAVTLLYILPKCLYAIGVDFLLPYFLRGKTLEKMALKTDIAGKVDLLSGLDVKVGDVVKTCSRLAPMGKVRIGSTEVEAKSMGEFIDPEKPVSIEKIEGNIVLVKPAE